MRLLLLPATRLDGGDGSGGFPRGPRTRRREVSAYRFGLRTADFLVCRTCGVFVAALCDVDGATYATLNCNVLEARDQFTQAPARADYEGETAEERMARRRRLWTPAAVQGWRRPSRPPADPG